VASSRALKDRKISDVIEGSSLDMAFQDLGADQIAQYDKLVDLWFLAMPDKQSGEYLAHIGYGSRACWNTRYSEQPAN
jgi:N-acetyl-gamma-glutamylphosphate reductase